MPPNVCYINYQVLTWIPSRERWEELSKHNSQTLQLNLSDWLELIFFSCSSFQKSWYLHWDVSRSALYRCVSSSKPAGCWTPVMRNFQVFSPSELQFFCLLPEDLKHATKQHNKPDGSLAPSVNKSWDWWRQQFSLLFVWRWQIDTKS